MRFQAFVNNGQAYQNPQLIVIVWILSSFCHLQVLDDWHQGASVFRHLSTAAKHTQPLFVTVRSTIFMLPFAAYQVDHDSGHALSDICQQRPNIQNTQVLL